MAQMAGIGNIKVDFIKSYVVQESWENDTKGNPITIFSALGLSTDDLSAAQVYVMLFKNNNVSNTIYKCDYIYRAKNTNNRELGSYVVRNNKSAYREFSSDISTWASIGTVIEVYKITYDI